MRILLILLLLVSCVNSVNIESIQHEITLVPDCKNHETKLTKFSHGDYSFKHMIDNPELWSLYSTEISINTLYQKRTFTDTSKIEIIYKNIKKENKLIVTIEYHYWDSNKRGKVYKTEIRYLVSNDRRGRKLKPSIIIYYGNKMFPYREMFYTDGRDYAIIDGEVYTGVEYVLLDNKISRIIITKNDYIRIVLDRNTKKKIKLKYKNVINKVAFDCIMNL